MFTTTAVHPEVDAVAGPTLALVMHDDGVRLGAAAHAVNVRSLSLAFEMDRARQPAQIPRINLR
jgi:hypothetical protein